LRLPDHITYGLYYDFRLLAGNEVPAIGFDQFAVFGSAGQVHLKIVPVHRQQVLVCPRRADQPLVLQDNQRHIQMPFEALPRIELAGSAQKLTAIEPAILRRVAFRNRRGDRGIVAKLFLVRGIDQHDARG
jgi:hypothetical protein